MLPSGVSNPRFLTLFGKQDTRFGPNGENQPLGVRLNKSVSWNDVLDSQTDNAQRTLVQSILNDEGLTNTGSAGQATGVVNAAISAQVPVLAFGVMDRLTAALVVPVIRADVKVDTGFIRSPDGQRFIGAVCEISPDQCNDAAAKLNSATAQKLSRLGYQPLQSKTLSGLGDLQLRGRYLGFTDDKHSGLLQLGLSLPTGQAANPDDVLDIGIGEGRYKLGFTLVYNRTLFHNLSFDIYGGGNALLPNEMLRRLPASHEDSLSADKVSVIRDWGAQASAGSTLNYRFPQWGVTLTAGYSFQYQSQTRYQGALTETLTEARYGFLEDLEPAQTLHSLVASLEFSTVEWFQRQVFALPFQLRAAYSRTFAGRNVPSGDLFVGELVAFL